MNEDPEIYGSYSVYSDNMSAYVTRNGKVVKRFSGESAWSDAERWASDKYFAEMYG